MGRIIGRDADSGGEDGEQVESKFGIRCSMLEMQVRFYYLISFFSRNIHCAIGGFHIFKLQNVQIASLSHCFCMFTP
ncbi:hypothetical protein EMGBS15_05600 [Filimonas sp.]|nr:hypothetical protein EMGBS15_05600 [Filimonas sp.]